MANDTALISLPADELLVRFGDENATPGSGCAAALMGLVAASLICAVARLTDRPPTKIADRERAALILTVTEQRLIPALKELFQKDADIFEPIVDLRRRRDLAQNVNDRRQLSRQANAALEPATEILFEMVAVCFELIQNGTALYSVGFRGARGDTGAALSAAVAGISSAVFVIALNAKTSKATWAAEAIRRADEVQERLRREQATIFRLVRESKDEAMEAIQRSFDSITGGFEPAK